MLGAVYAGNGFLGFIGHHFDDSQAALALAAKQQARIATPTPLRPADNDDSEVGLDDPANDLPIWWLGPRLPQRGELPALQLRESVPPALVVGRNVRRDAGPGMIYGRPGAYADVRLVLARPRLLHRPAMHRELRRLRRDPCSQIRHVALRDGRATIFQRSPRCPSST